MNQPSQFEGTVMYSQINMEGNCTLAKMIADKQERQCQAEDDIQWLAQKAVVK